MTKYCIDASGNYLGGFPEVPAGATEVPTAPDHAKQKWGGTSWDAYTRPQTEQDIEFLERGVLKLAQVVIDIAQQLVDTSVLDPSQFTAQERQNFIQVRDAVARLK